MLISAISLKLGKFWPLLATVLLLSGALYLLHNATQGSPARTYKHFGGGCVPGVVSFRAAAIFKNYSGGHSAFLQLSDFMWHKNTSPYSLPYGTNGGEDALVQALAAMSQSKLPAEIERLPCKRCVVIGNGFQMKNSSLGEIIDHHDVVIRINNAPVKDHEEDVGSKTSLRFFYPESAHFDLDLDNNPDTLLVLVPFKTVDALWIKTMVKDEKLVNESFWKAPPLIWDANVRNIRIQNPYFVHFAATQFLGWSRKKLMSAQTPTTGLIAISFAIHFCDQVSIAGFGYPRATNTSQPIHYFGNNTMKDMSETNHNIGLEHLAIRRLLHHRVIHNLTLF